MERVCNGTKQSPCATRTDSQYRTEKILDAKEQKNVSESRMDTLLGDLRSDVYYDLKRADSYGSAAGLKRQSKLNKVNDFLMKQDAYTLHRNLKRRFKRRKTYVPGIDHLWQMDLVDLSSLSRYNDGYRYLLTCIDVFSKYGRVATLKSKTGVAVRDAFESMIQDTKPLYVQTDKGTEFLNTNLQKLLSDNDIKHYTSQNEDIKCAVVERWNRTLMTKLHRYFTHKNTLHYLRHHSRLGSLLQRYVSLEHKDVAGTS